MKRAKAARPSGVPEYDPSSKLVIAHFSGAILKLAGHRGVTRSEPIGGELVQTRQLPDGLVQVRYADRPAPAYALIEIGTYPEKRMVTQLARGSAMTWLHRRQWPDAVGMVLAPRGRYRVADHLEMHGPTGVAFGHFGWKVIELWTLPAEQLLADGDLGMVPWVPLAQYSGDAEALLRECRRRIDRQASAVEHPVMLGVAHMLGRLKYDRALLARLFGGSEPMIESPWLGEVIEEQNNILRRKQIDAVLRARFQRVPVKLRRQLDKIESAAELDRLHLFAVTCPDLAAFQSELT